MRETARLRITLRDGTVLTEPIPIPLPEYVEVICPTSAAEVQADLMRWIAAGAAASAEASPVDIRTRMCRRVIRPDGSAGYVER